MTITLINTDVTVADASKVNENFTTTQVAINDIYNQISTLNTTTGDVVNIVDYGATTESLDNTAEIALAQVEARSSGRPLFIPPGTFFGLIEVQHDDVIMGAGKYKSTIKAPTGSTSSVITGKDADYLMNNSPPTNSLTEGANKVTIRDITIDGNKQNNTSGCGIKIWGCAMNIQDVNIRQCAHDGMYTKWNTGWMPMEGTFTNISIDNVGYHGWRFDGPHDSQVTNMIIVDASQSIDNGFMGVLIGYNSAFASARFYNLHVWHKSTSTNRCFAAVQSAGNSEFIACHFEGCRDNQLRHMGQSDRVVACRIYAPFGVSGSSLVTFNGNLNHHIGNEYHAGNGIETTESVFGIQIGESNAAASNHIIGGSFLGFKTRTPFNFVNSAGHNTIIGRGWTPTGGTTTFGGTMHVTDEVDYHQTGTYINYRKPQSYLVYSSNTAAASGGVPVGGLYILSTTNALTVRT